MNHANFDANSLQSTTGKISHFSPFLSLILVLTCDPHFTKLKHQRQANDFFRWPIDEILLLTCGTTKTSRLFYCTRK